MPSSVVIQFMFLGIKKFSAFSELIFTLNENALNFF